MKISILILMLLSLFPAAAKADREDDTCHGVADAYYIVAVSLQAGLTLPEAITTMRETVATLAVHGNAHTNTLRKLYSFAIQEVYSQPTVQPQVWWGYKLAQCQAANHEPFFITKAPKSNKD